MSSSPLSMNILRVNLLDWREKRREERKKQFGILLGGSAVAGALVCLAVIAYFNNHLDAQHARNDRLKSEIKLMEAKIAEIKDLEKVREDLIARTQVIEKLQQSRAETVHFFDELTKTVPDGLFLTRVEQRGEETQIDGIAESNGRVSTYIRNMESAEWLHNPRLVYIKAINRNGRRLSEFSLRVRVGAKASKNAEEEVIVE